MTALTALQGYENLSRSKREEAMPITLGDIKPGIWLVAENDVVGRRRMIVVDSRNKLMTVSNTGYVMLDDMTPQELYDRYKVGWRVEK